GVIVGAVLATNLDFEGREGAAAAPSMQTLSTVIPRREAPQPTTWHSIIEAVPDPVVAIDRDLMVVYANQSAHHIFPALRHGGPIALPSRSPELADALAEALDDRQTHSVRLHERVPVERRLDATVSPLTAFDAGMPALLVVLHDISERDRLAQMRAD